MGGVAAGVRAGDVAGGDGGVVVGVADVLAVEAQGGELVGEERVGVADAEVDSLEPGVVWRCSSSCGRIPMDFQAPVMFR